MKFICILLLLVSPALLAAESQEGLLIYEVGDTKDGSVSYENFYLQTRDALIPLNASQAFKDRMPLHAWSGKQISVTFKDADAKSGDQRDIFAIELLEGESSRGGGVSGTQKWISLLCKFSDKPAEQENLAYFQEMYANTPAGLDHYWREVSYDKVNVAGSIAVDWVELPSPQTSYIPTPGSGNSSSILGPLFEDCTAAADPFVDFTDGFVGINMMFNDSLNCCAWGGGRGATLDGQFQSWRVTWNPPWAFANSAVIAHEMGHGMGLPHSNNSDGDGDPYDSPWDVMSSATSNAVNDNVYGRLGKHINMYHKYRLDWVEDVDGYTVQPGDNLTKTVNWTALTTTANEKFIRIPLSDGTSYFIEARQESGQYESNIVDTAVIIHHVDTSRGQPAWIVDADNPPANFANTEGVMWKVGETFVDPIDGYQVEILEQVTNGFRVRLTGVNDIIFRNGFQ